MTTSAELESACLVAEAVASLIDAMGMHALNQCRLSRGLSIAYNDAAFNNVSGSLEKSIAELKANHPLVFGTPTETPVDKVPESPLNTGDMLASCDLWPQKAPEGEEPPKCWACGNMSPALPDGSCSHCHAGPSR